MPIFNELCGFDVFSFYKKYSVGQGYLRLSRGIKKKYVDEMQSTAETNGMRFYISDRDM